MSWVKPRTCGCCGDTKPSTSFKKYTAKGECASLCTDCNVWLTLLREVFGPDDSEYVDERPFDRLIACWGGMRLPLDVQPANDSYHSVWRV